MVKHLFDDDRLRAEIGAWAGTYDRVKIIMDQEIERNVREALGKVELPGLPGLNPPRILIEAEVQILGPGWNTARDWLKEKIDAVMKEYHAS